MNNRPHPSKNSLYSKLTSYWITRLGTILIVTLAAFALALYARRISEYPSLSLANLIDTELGAYEVGVVFGVSSALWMGLVSGFWVGLLGERRFTPLIAMGLGMGISLGAICLTAISWEDWTYLTPFLIPSVLMSGLAVAAIALIVRNVQAEADRRKAEAAKLALTRAELRALRAQINPHFLFNALNTIRYFVRTDAGAARRLLLDLSEVFQRALCSGEFVSLRDELSYVEAYLALEKARLDQRLQVAWSIQTDSGTKGRLINWPK